MNGASEAIPLKLTWTFWCTCLDICCYYSCSVIVVIIRAVTASWLVLLLPLPPFRSLFSTSIQNDLSRPKSEPVTHLKILLLDIKAHVLPGPPGPYIISPLIPLRVLSHVPLPPSLPPLPPCWPGPALAAPPAWHVLPPGTLCRVADLANNLQCLGHIYIKKLFTVYVKFRFTRASYICPVGNPHGFLSHFLQIFAQMSPSCEGLLWTYYVNFQLPSSIPIFLLRFIFIFGIHHQPWDFYSFVYFLSPSLHGSSMRAGIFRFVSICSPSAKNKLSNKMDGCTYCI